MIKQTATYGVWTVNRHDDGKSIKRIEDGQIIIYRNGVRYNALGTEIR